MRHLFTSESVSEGQPDKMADQISDALLDNYLAFDKNSKVACETLVTTGQVVVAGEIKTNSIIDHDKIIRNVINDIGYNKSQYSVGRCSASTFICIYDFMRTTFIKTHIYFISPYSSNWDYGSISVVKWTLSNSTHLFKFSYYSYSL